VPHLRTEAPDKKQMTNGFRYCPEDISSAFLRNIGGLLPNHTAQDTTLQKYALFFGGGGKSAESSVCIVF
jgi:hypothetical protein